MEQSLSIHQVLLSRNKSKNWPYMSSILIRNENVPFFEEQFGQLDHDWLLKATKERKCVEIDPCVLRYVNGKNLSLDPEYRRRDFYLGLLQVDGDIRTMKRWYSSRARYHYIQGEIKLARFHFIRGDLNWKTILYFLSTFNNSLRKVIIKKFRVWG